MRPLQVISLALIILAISILSFFVVNHLICSRQINIILTIEETGYWNNNEWVVEDTCVVLRSRTQSFFVDQVWLGNFIREQGGDIFYTDWYKLCFTIEENNYKEFIEDLKPKLIIVIKKRDMQVRRIK